MDCPFKPVPESMETKTVQFIKKRNYQAIAKDKVVRLRYVVFEQGSEQALAYRDDLYYLHGGYGGAFPKVEQALAGLSVDAKAEVITLIENRYDKKCRASQVLACVGHTL